MGLVNNIVDQLLRDEGEVLTPYRDSMGYLTIGVGHNLDAKPISARASRVILEDDIMDTITDIAAHVPSASALSPVRYAVLINLAFNVGIQGLLGFRKMLAALQAGDYAEAARELLDSKYATQVGARAKRLAVQLETGVWQ